MILINKTVALKHYILFITYIFVKLLLFFIYLFLSNNLSSKSNTHKQNYYTEKCNIYNINNVIQCCSHSYRGKSQKKNS